MHYKTLLDEAENEKIEIVEMEFLSKRTKGFYEDNIIGLSKYIDTTAERTCILAEELGHYYTTVGDILDQSKIENRKQELIARRWAVNQLIRVEDFINAFNEGVSNRAELAEFLARTLQHPVTVWDFMEVAWMTTSATLIGGALGSGFESKDDILRAAYGQRERHRRQATDEGV